MGSISGIYTCRAVSAVTNDSRVRSLRDCSQSLPSRAGDLRARPQVSFPPRPLSRHHVGGAPDLPRRDFADGATWGHRIVRELEAGASGWIYWNLLLDRRGGPYALSPAHGDAADNWQHPVVVVDTEQGTFEPTGLFYFLAHFSRFVRPGATRLGTRQTADLAVRRVSAVAFASGSSSSAEEPQTVMQLVNRGTTPQRVAVCAGDGRVADVVLPAVSITTATWDAL